MTYGGTTYGGTAYGSTGVSASVLQASVSILTLDHESDAITGAGSATIGAAVETIQLDHPAATVQTPFSLAAPTSVLSLDHGDPAITGAGTASITATAETLQFVHPSPAFGSNHWVLDGNPVPTRVDETATHQDLDLSFRVSTQTLLNVLRDAKVDENQVDVLPTDDGGFTAIDRAGGANTVTLIPPVFRKPLRQEGDYHVSGYEEDLVSQDIDEWDVSLDTVRDGHRAESVSINETASGDEWAIDTRFGTIATDRVSADVLGTGADGVERFELTLTLDIEQAHAFEAALSRVGGARVRDIPDGSNIAVDDTSDGAASVTLTVPDGGEIQDGDYVVFEWSAERQNDRVERYDVEIARKG